MKDNLEQQNLDAYEAEAGYTLEFPDPQLAIDVNRKNVLDDFSEQETRVLELLMQEGYFECGD